MIGAQSKRILNYKPILKSRVAKPKLKLIGGVVQCVRISGMRNWWLASRDRNVMNVLREANVL